LPLFTDFREEFFLETGLPMYLSAGNWYPRRASFCPTKGGGLVVGSEVVDRDLTVTQVNNCEQPE
jgi:hypothetical protein